jgi:transcription-repair coupling factor (superfamily II helicase)
MPETALNPRLVETLAKAEEALVVTGAPEGIDAAALGEAARLRGGVTLFVARDETRASSFEAAVRFFTPGLATLRLPAWDTLPYDRISPAASVAAQRCAALAALARRKPSEPPLLVIATASAIAQRVPPRARLNAATFAATTGAETSMADLENYLVVNGYSRSSTVRAPGEFAVRGGLMDVFPPGAVEPLRFDFFGDELEAIRSFDPETQISKAKLKEALLTPVSEVLLDDQSVLHFRKRFGQSFGTVSDTFYDSVSARIRRQGVEQWLPFFYDILETVFD